MFAYDALLEAFKRWLCVVGAVCVCVRCPTGSLQEWRHRRPMCRLPEAIRRVKSGEPTDREAATVGGVRGKTTPG